VARRLRRLALYENTCQHRSEDFVPPAAQRYAVRPITQAALRVPPTPMGRLTPDGVIIAILDRIASFAQASVGSF